VSPVSGATLTTLDPKAVLRDPITGTHLVVRGGRAEVLNPHRRSAFLRDRSHFVCDEARCTAQQQRATWRTTGRSGTNEKVGTAGTPTGVDPALRVVGTGGCLSASATGPGSKEGRIAVGASRTEGGAAGEGDGVFGLMGSRAGGRRRSAAPSGEAQIEYEDFMSGTAGGAATSRPFLDAFAAEVAAAEDAVEDERAAVLIRAHARGLAHRKFLAEAAAANCDVASSVGDAAAAVVSADATEAEIQAAIRIQATERGRRERRRVQLMRDRAIDGVVGGSESHRLGTDGDASLRLSTMSADAAPPKGVGARGADTVAPWESDTDAHAAAVRIQAAARGRAARREVAALRADRMTGIIPEDPAAEEEGADDDPDAAADPDA